MMSLHLIGPDSIQYNRQLHRFLIAQDFKLHFVAFEFALDYFGHLHALAFEFDKTIAGNGVIIDGKQNVALFKNLSRRTGFNHGSNNYSSTIVRQSEIAPLWRVLQVARGQTKIDILIVVSIFDVGKEAANYRRRDHVGNPLRHIAAVTLKGDSNYLAILHDRPAAIPRIDLRADLNGKVLVDRRMGVELEINARNDPGSDRHALATNWVTIGRDGRFQLRDSPEPQRNHVFEKLR